MGSEVRAFFMMTSETASHRLNLLESDIQNLRVEFRRFLNGATDTPPTQLVEHVRQRIVSLRTELSGAADRFRLNSLESQFTSYRELFSRRMRDQEGGRRRPPAQAPTSSEPTIVLDEIGTEQAQVIYEDLYRGKSEPTVDLPGFTQYLEKQRRDILKRRGGTGVQFRVAEQNGKRQLKIRPVFEENS